jgi:hypothetical protein
VVSAILFSLAVAGAFLLGGLAVTRLEAVPFAQPNMQRALEHLRAARMSLEKAEHNKGGHRAKAIEHTQAAIDEVKKGIDAGR